VAGYGEGTIPGIT